MRIIARQRGLSLIEVLVAVLIFSIGLLGLASLLVLATRSNQVAYLRTQVTFLAGNMADRMRANPRAMWDGAYSATYPTTATQSCDTAACTPAQLAVRDKLLWSNLLTQFLPNPTATIACTAPSPSTAQLAVRAPYGGDCTMTINWTERAAGDPTHSDAATQTLVWEFQP